MTSPTTSGNSKTSWDLAVYTLNYSGDSCFPTFRSFSHFAGNHTWWRNGQKSTMIWKDHQIYSLLAAKYLEHLVVVTEAEQLGEQPLISKPAFDLYCAKAVTWASSSPKNPKNTFILKTNFEQISEFLQNFHFFCGNQCDITCITFLVHIFFLGLIVVATVVAV